jgi:hypothetical protein
MSASGDENGTSSTCDETASFEKCGQSRKKQRNQSVNNELAIPAGFEPATIRLEGECSIH